MNTFINFKIDFFSPTSIRPAAVCGYVYWPWNIVSHLELRALTSPTVERGFVCVCGGGIWLVGRRIYEHTNQMCIRDSY